MKIKPETELLTLVTESRLDREKMYVKEEIMKETGHSEEELNKEGVIRWWKRQKKALEEKGWEYGRVTGESKYHMKYIGKSGEGHKIQIHPAEVMRERKEIKIKSLRKRLGYDDKSWTRYIEEVLEDYGLKKSEDGASIIPEYTVPEDVEKETEITLNKWRQGEVKGIEVFKKFYEMKLALPEYEKPNTELTKKEVNKIVQSRLDIAVDSYRGQKERLRAANLLKIMYEVALTNMYNEPMKPYYYPTPFHEVVLVEVYKKAIEPDIQGNVPTVDNFLESITISALTWWDKSLVDMLMYFWEDLREYGHRPKVSNREIELAKQYVDEAYLSILTQGGQSSQAENGAAYCRKYPTFLSVTYMKDMRGVNANPVVA